MFGYQNKKESGAIIISGSHVASTQQCVHCGRHERIVRGSGNTRGWCTKCAGFLCGRRFCMQSCVPYEARIEYEEALFAKREEQIRKLLSQYPNIQSILV